MTGMKSTFQVINRMVTDGVIGTYAVCEAVAALNYIEPMLTDDLDVLISVDRLGNQPRPGLVGGGTPAIGVRTLRAEHDVATALKVGRPKDRIRITEFLSENAVDLGTLHAVLKRHDLLEAWSKFCAQTGIPDPNGLSSEPRHRARPASIRTFPTFFAARLKGVAIWHLGHSVRKSKFSRHCASVPSRSGRRAKHVGKTECSHHSVRRENRSSDFGRLGFLRVAKPRCSANRLHCQRNPGT